MDVKTLDIQNWNRYNNDLNLMDYSERTNPNIRPGGQDCNLNTDLKYYGHYYVNGKVNKHRTLKLGETRLITSEEADLWYKEEQDAKRI